MKLTAYSLLLVVALACSSSVDAGDARRITLDGLPRDWRGVPRAAADPAGDGRPGGVDLGRLWLANDAEHLYLRLDVGRETLLQNPIDQALGNRLRLFLDVDGSPATGKRVGSLGVELEARFGERQVFVYDAAGDGGAVAPGAGLVLTLPTHSSRVFEMRVPFTTPEPPRLVRLMLREEGGDRLPDRGVLRYRPSRRPVEELAPLDLARPGDGHVRFLSLNVERSLIASRRALYQRFLRAVAPDVLNFQSLHAWDAEQTRLYVSSVLPHPEGGAWHAAGVADCVTVSAYPIVASAAVDDNLLVRIDLPDERTPHDLVLFNVHLPCCTDDAGRDRESDRLAATWRDLLAGAGPFVIEPDDAVVVLGDFNFVGHGRQLRAVRDGLFIDPANGPDFAPGRGNGSLATAPLRHTHAALTHTWRRSASPFAPGKLDYVFYSDDVAELGNDFVLDTATMPVDVLRRHRLRPADSLLLSDHLPLVADLLFRVAAPPRR